MTKEVFFKFCKNYESDHWASHCKQLNELMHKHFGFFSGQRDKIRTRVVFQELENLPNKTQRKLNWEVSFTELELEACFANPIEFNPIIWEISKASLLKAISHSNLKPNYGKVDDSGCSITFRQYSLKSIENASDEQSYVISMKYLRQHGLTLVVSVTSPKKFLLNASVQDQVPLFLRHFITTLTKTFSCYEVQTPSASYKDEIDPSPVQLQAA